MADITIAPAYDGTNNSTGDFELAQTGPAMVTYDATRMYIALVRSSSAGTSEGVYLWESTDGGQTWPTENPITTDGILSSSPAHSSTCLWYDRWTPGYTATDLITVVGNRLTNPSGGTRWRQFTASTGAQAQPESTLESTATSTFAGDDLMGLTAARDGALWFTLCNISSGGFSLYRNDRSPNAFGGAVTTTAPTGLNINSTLNKIQILPSPNDPEDILFFASSTSSLRVWEYDQSENQWSAAVTLASAVGGNDNAGRYDFACTIRHIDHRIFVAFRPTDIVGSTILQLLYVDNPLNNEFGVLSQIASGGASDVLSMPQLCMVQTSGELYAGFARGTSGTQHVYYTRSMDGGLSWESEQQFSGTSSGTFYPGVYMPMSTAETGEGLLAMAWFEGDGSTENWKASDSSNMAVGGYRTSPTDVDQTQVDCETGQVPASGESGPRLIPGRFPNSSYQQQNVTPAGAMTTWFPYDSKSGDWNAGDVAVGSTSGARGTIVGFLSNPNRIGITGITSGPGSGNGTPFIPNENLINQTTDLPMKLADRIVVNNNPLTEVAYGPPNVAI